MRRSSSAPNAVRLPFAGPVGIGRRCAAKALIDALEPRFPDGIGWIPLDRPTEAA